MSTIHNSESDHSIRILPQTIATEKRQSATAVLQDRIVRPAEQVLITGRSLASIWRDQQAGTYPPSIRIGANAVGVRLSALMAWLDSRETITPENTKPVAPGRKKVGRPRKQKQAEV